MEVNPIRPMTPQDVAGLVPVLDATGLFPADMLDGMTAPWRADPASALWLVAAGKDGVAGFCHARPEALTEGTWNLPALAVHPAAQRQGIAAALVCSAEAALRDRGGRLCIVDTAGTPDFAAARRLYARLGYAEEARIRAFWAEGVDKVTYAKRL